MVSPFAAMEEAQRLTQVRNARRHASAREAYTQALALIEGFGLTQDASGLEHALELLQKSIESDRQQAAPQALLGLIFLGLNQPSEAARYFRQARELEPEHPLVRQLQVLMLQGLHQTDESEHKAEELLSELGKQIQVIESQFVPTLNVATLSEQQQLLSALRAQENDLQRCGDDLLALKQGLLPIEAKLKEFEQLMVHSRNLQTLADRIARNGQRALSGCRRLQAPGQLFPASELEQILDECDAIADALDACDAQGWSITLIKPAYKEMLAKVGVLQDVLDEI